MKKLNLCPSYLRHRLKHVIDPCSKEIREKFFPRNFHWKNTISFDSKNTYFGNCNRPTQGTQGTSLSSFTTLNHFIRANTMDVLVSWDLECKYVFWSLKTLCLTLSARDIEHTMSKRPQQEAASLTYSLNMTPIMDHANRCKKSTKNGRQFILHISCIK